MTDIYRTLGVSKQASSQYRRRVLARQKTVSTLELFRPIKAEMIALRKRHPRMGCRKIYVRLHDRLAAVGIGRDRFEQLAFQNGYRLKRRPSRYRTTRRGSGARRTNLIKGMTVTNINQVWASDITYVIRGPAVFYLTIVLDVYSRRIIGHVLTRTLRAEEIVVSLRRALHTRGYPRGITLIHHSDEGSQYTSTVYMEMAKRFGITMSFADNAVENPYAERVHGTIKNEYLAYCTGRTFEELSHQTTRSIALYNEERPHQSILSMRSPMEFERWVLSLDPHQRPTVKIYTEADGSKQEASTPVPPVSLQGGVNREE